MRERRALWVCLLLVDWRRRLECFKLGFERRDVGIH